MNPLFFTLLALTFGDMVAMSPFDIQALGLEEGNTTEPDTCSGCIVGTFMWVSPPPYKNSVPYEVGKEIVLKWTRQNAPVAPEKVSIMIKTRENNKWESVVDGLDGSATEYKWIPKNLSTWTGYRLIVFETAYGREGVPPGGHARSATSNELGFYNPNEGSGGKFYADAGPRLNGKVVAFGVLMALLLAL